mgnify:CR=1 FL=1
MSFLKNNGRIFCFEKKRHKTTCSKYIHALDMIVICYMMCLERIVTERKSCKHGISSK